MRCLPRLDGIAAALVVILVSVTAIAQQPKAKKNPFELTPPQMDQDRVEKKLSNAIDDVCVGGGGRFIILHVPQDRKITVFDVSKNDFVGSVAADDDQVQFAAGAEKLFVYLGNSSVITRFSLDTLKSETTLRLTPKSKVDGLHMGSAATGPLMVTGLTDLKKETTFFVNTVTMKLADFQHADPKQRTTHWGNGHTIRVSANGRVFGHWRTNSSPQGFFTLALTGTTYKTNYEHVSYGHVVPGPDGKVIYTAHGLFTPEGRPLGDQKTDFGYKLDYCLPAVEGNLYYMSLGTTPNRQVESLNIHFVGDKRPLAVLTDVEVPADRLFQYDRGKLGLEKRILLIPSADVIVSIPKSNDRLIVQKFNLESYLKDSPFDYLVVTSKPPSSCRRDAVYNYDIKAMSKKGGLKYRIETGPKGMSVDENGKLSWRVPLLLKDTKTHVVVMVSDAGGTDKPHSFDINILDRLP